MAVAKDWLWRIGDPAGEGRGGEPAEKQSRRCSEGGGVGEGREEEGQDSQEGNDTGSPHACSCGLCWERSICEPSAVQQHLLDVHCTASQSSPANERTEACCAEGTTRGGVVACKGADRGGEWRGKNNDA